MLVWRLMTYYGAIVVGIIFTAMDKRIATDSHAVPPQAAVSEAPSETPPEAASPLTAATTDETGADE